MKINSTKLLFLYRTPLFHFVHFKTDKIEFKNIVTALNIKKRKERITYVFDESVKFIDNYYNKDLCKFKNGKCIVQRKTNSNHCNGCCRTCPLVTDKGCPSTNITCKLIYCKTSIGNTKLLKVGDIKIFKCLSIFQRLIILGDTFSTREKIIKDAYYGPLYWVPKELIKDIKREVREKKMNKKEKALQ